METNIENAFLVNPEIAQLVVVVVVVLPGSLLRIGGGHGRHAPEPQEPGYTPRSVP